MSRNFSIIFLTVLLVLGLAAAASAGNSIKVKLDDNLINFEQPPVIEDGTTLVPVRAIFEKYGMTVNYYDRIKAIIAEDANNTISMTVDSKTAYVNGQPVEMKVAPKIIGGRTMVPLRFISESLGTAVDWDESTGTIYLKSGVNKSSASDKIVDLIGNQVEDALESITQQQHNTNNTEQAMPFNNPVTQSDTRLPNAQNTQINIPQIPKVSTPAIPKIPPIPKY